VLLLPVAAAALARARAAVPPHARNRNRARNRVEGGAPRRQHKNNAQRSTLNVQRPTSNAQVRARAFGLHSSFSMLRPRPTFLFSLSPRERIKVRDVPCFPRSNTAARSLRR